jgi:wyosine [tRNA(Phe)-imidazoG37] synthetase (radical SAM superfamily)
MATFLFDRVVFGPVKSRRLGVSLGINLLPTGNKWCSFNCIYCECGWSQPGPYGKEGFPPREMVRNELEKKLAYMAETGERPDAITFAGNGEPTLHPAFAGIIEDTLVLRDRFAREARVAVLSNGTMLDDPGVFNALKKADQNILKIDSARLETFRLLNQPPEGFSLERLVGNISRFQGNFILQTLFVRGIYRGTEINNAGAGEVAEWLELVERLRPAMVMVYTIARGTPARGLHKISVGELEDIARRVRELGIGVQVSG